MNIRFFWLAAAIIVPLLSVQYISQETDRLIELTYIVVAIFSETIVISLAIAEFAKVGREIAYLKEKQIKEDRDNDLSKWRKEFFNDSLNLYEMQKESLKRAKDLTSTVSENTVSDKQQNPKEEQT